MTKDTACSDCPFKKMGFSECPNYIETLWHEKDNPQPVIIKDCAPKRTLLMLQELYNRTFSLQCQITQHDEQIGNCRADVRHLIEFHKYLEEQKLAEISQRKKLADHLKSIQAPPYERIDHVS